MQKLDKLASSAQDLPPSTKEAVQVETDIQAEASNSLKQRTRLKSKSKHSREFKPNWKPTRKLKLRLLRKHKPKLSWMHRRKLKWAR